MINFKRFLLFFLGLRNSVSLYFSLFLKIKYKSISVDKLIL